MRIKTNKKVVGLLCVLMVSVFGTGCGSTEKSEDYSSVNEIEGYVNLGTVYQEEGISTGEKLLYWTDWDDLELKIICQDPTCQHLPHNYKTNPDPTCSASVKDYVVSSTETMVYGNNRLIFEPSFETSYDEESGYSSQCEYHTDIYKCAMDGSDRKKVASFDGIVDLNAGVICNDVLYFSSTKKITYTYGGDYIDEDGISGVFSSSAYTHQLCSLNLSEMNVTTYIVEGDFYTGFSVTDDYVYCTNTADDVTALYRINRQTDECDEVYRSDGYFYLNGGIGHQLMISTQNADDGCFDYYLYDEQTQETKELLKGPSGNACVVGDRFAVMTESLKQTKNDDEKDYAVTYSFYNSDGELDQEIHFKDQVQLMFSIGDHLIYNLTPSEDFSKKSGIYEADLKNIDQAIEQGTYIFSGISDI